MKKKVEDYIKKHNLLKENERWLLAVSGGPDSVALLDVIAAIAPVYKAEVMIAHYNHCLRPEAEAEALFVKELAEKYGFAFWEEREDVKKIALQKKISLETAARILRYRFLQEILKKQGCQKIITGHHLNDQAETILMHLIRGAGLEGLAAIYPAENNLIRPLLGIKKTEILAYCHKNDLSYCLDQSNKDTKYLRNWVRLDLIPHLEQINPKINETVARTAEICRLDNEYLKAETEKKMRECLFEKWDGIKKYYFLKGTEFWASAPALRQRMLLQIFAKLEPGSGKQITYDNLQGILSLADGKMISLPGKILVIKKEGNYVFYSKKDKVRESQKHQKQFLIKKGCCYPIFDGDKMLQIEEKEGVYEPGTCLTELAVAKKYLQEPLQVRFRQAGDYFVPSGTKGGKKLKKFFIDEKIPLEKRDKLPLLLAGKRILWVIGLRPAEGLLPQKGEEYYLFKLV